MADEIRPGRAEVERRITRGGKDAVFVRAEIVKDSDNTYTLFLGNLAASISFRRGEHRAFDRLDSIFDQ